MGNLQRLRPARQRPPSRLGVVNAIVVLVKDLSGEPVQNPVVKGRLKLFLSPKYGMTVKALWDLMEAVAKDLETPLASIVFHCSEELKFREVQQYVRLQRRLELSVLIEREAMIPKEGPQRHI